MINSLSILTLQNKSKRNYTSIYIIILIKFFLTLISCSPSPSPNLEFEEAQKINTLESYNTFLSKYPNSPQILKANLQIEKLKSLEQTINYKINSEINIEISSKEGKFIDNKGTIKQILEFYRSKSNRESFSGVDGIKIVYDYFPTEGAKQALVISHGTGESSIRYAEVVFDLLNNNIPYSIFVINHRGHGFSQRMIGNNKDWNPNWNVYEIDQEEVQDYRKIYVRDFEDYVKDFGALVNLIKDKYKIEKVTAMGHSLGGAVVARYAEQNPSGLNKMILSAPMFSIIGLLGADNNDYISKAIISISDTFSSKGYAIGGGGASFSHFSTKYDTEENTLNYYTTSYNRFFMKKYLLQENPETSLGGLTWGFVDAIYEIVKDIRSDALKIKTPTMIFQAEFDDYVHPSGQDTVCNQININTPGLCKIIKIENAKHELFLERDYIRNKVMSQILDSLGSTESNK
jgi:lysophospholipase